MIKSLSFQTSNDGWQAYIIPYGMNNANNNQAIVFNFINNIKSNTLLQLVKLYP